MWKGCEGLGSPLHVEFGVGGYVVGGVWSNIAPAFMDFLVTGLLFDCMELPVLATCFRFLCQDCTRHRTEISIMCSVFTYMNDDERRAPSQMVLTNLAKNITILQRTSSIMFSELAEVPKELDWCIWESTRVYA